MRKTKRIGNKEYRLDFAASVVEGGMLVYLYKCVAPDNLSVVGFVGIIERYDLRTVTPAISTIGPLCPDKNNATYRARMCAENRFDKFRRAYDEMIRRWNGRDY